MGYQYQRTNRYFASVSEDIKNIASEELLSLGAKDVKPVYKGIYFSADKSDLYKIIFRTRFINKVFAPLINFDVHSDKYLYKTAKQIEWSDFLSKEKTFSVHSIVINSNIKHSKFAALRLKDAIADYFREKFGERPSVNKDNPDLFIELYIENNHATISIDLAGGSLHKRGYKIESMDAPMSEITAAAIIDYTEWEGDIPLYDLCCGSGTLVCEAYIKATNTPAAILRKNFGFRNLPDFDNKLWKKIKEDEINKIHKIDNNMIFGSDISKKAIDIAKRNCSFVDKRGKINLKQRDLFSVRKIENSIIICNPPYGIRMGKNDDLDLFYKNLGDFLKKRCKDSTAFIYFGDRKYIKKIGLKPRWKKILSTGGLDGRLVKYEIY